MFQGSFFTGRVQGQTRKMNIKYLILLGIDVNDNKTSFTEFFNN